MPVHGVSAENRFAVMAAHDLRSAWSAVKGSPDRVYARGADVKCAVQFRLRFSNASRLL